ncbi:LysR family transcriptional regulator [Paraburkholderia panacisoli]|uniref:LysR family transcriptional regulator n=1 Tax=Paraburkholderia panacisoli TaxID=2603818 RepID=A0A5B0HLT1_9BURK|nr:LysR family transcriptional regulator [Paraburkholderia panacisoli]KAA1016198.1 LysR family transcriptional regulator [Paraburkholderia panacisoli]
MDTFQKMRTFVRVAESGGFTAAAVRLNLATGQVSRAVSELEQHLRTRLFNRTTRRVALTEAGKRYLHRCYQILTSLDQAEAEASDAHVVPSGRLRVHATASFGQHYVMPAIMRYQKRYPQVTVELTLSQHVPDLIDEGYDVSIQLSGTELPTSGLIAVRVGTFYSILCASPSYLAERGTASSVADLADHTCLQTTSLTPARSHWDLDGPNGREVFDLPPSPFRVNIAEAMAFALRDGLGVGALPLWTALPWLRDGTLTRVLPSYRVSEMQIHALYTSREYLDAKIRSWVDFLQASIPQMLDDDELTSNQPRSR